MSTSTTNRSTTRTAAHRAVFAALLGAVLVGAAPVGPASAREVMAPPVVESVSPYAVPIAALGGRTLAQYLADHEARVVGPVGV
jgi:hypothetical protein